MQEVGVEWLYMGILGTAPKPPKDEGATPLKKSGQKMMLLQHDEDGSTPKGKNLMLLGVSVPKGAGLILFGVAAVLMFLGVTNKEHLLGAIHSTHSL